MKDIRLYYYEPGQLMKIGYSNKTHKFTSLITCIEYVKNLKKNKPSSWGNKQFIITEYTGAYESEIIHII